MTSARVATETDAANEALRHIKQDAIVDIADPVHRARECRRAFANVRDALLRRRDWNFALERIVPAQAPAAALGPLTRRYPLPEAVIKVRGVDGLADDEWAVEGGTSPGEIMVLVTNAEAPLVSCTVAREPRLWDALFVEVFALKLASAIAPTVARDGTLSDELDARAERKLTEAARIDSKEKAASSVPRRTSWLDARR